MSLIRVITDADFTDVTPYFINKVNRYSSRGVLFNDKNEIAMMFMKNKQCYKLPGGGIEENETKEQAFLREIQEETGYTSNITHELGIIEEHKKLNDFKQISYCFVARTVNKGCSNFTDKEIMLGMELFWMDIAEVLDVMNKSIESCDDYSTKFILLRDKTILDIIDSDFKKYI